MCDTFENTCSDGYWSVKKGILTLKIGYMFWSEVLWSCRHKIPFNWEVLLSLRTNILNHIWLKVSHLWLISTINSIFLAPQIYVTSCGRLLLISFNLFNCFFFKKSNFHWPGFNISGSAYEVETSTNCYRIWARSQAYQAKCLRIKHAPLQWWPQI